MNNRTVKIDTWFPRSVFVADNCCLENLVDFELTTKKVIQDNGSHQNGMLSVNSSHKTFDQLQNLDEFKPLVDEINKLASQYLTELGYTQEFQKNIYIANMWCNISYAGDFIFPHVHGNSVISGAFYVKSTENNKIRFFNNLQNMMPKAQEYNILNYEYCDYDCTPGRILLFSSDFLHGTEKQLDGEKIVLSFNLDLKK